MGYGNEGVCKMSLLDFYLFLGLVCKAMVFLQHFQFAFLKYHREGLGIVYRPEFFIIIEL